MSDEETAPLSLAVIVVNWNGAPLLRDCLASLVKQNSRVEIIVVDNGSVDDSEQVAREFKAAWIPVGRNIGLAAAFNLGAEHARASHLVFLNNDVALSPDFCSRILSSFADCPGLGALDVSHVSWNGAEETHRRTLFRASGDDLVTAGFIEIDADKTAPCAFASGACFGIPRESFVSIGGWDGGFFAGWEDVDLSWRLRASGLDVLYEPSIRIRHHVSASSSSPEGHRVRTLAAMTGRVRFALKHAPWRVVSLCVLRLLVGLVTDAVRGPSRVPLRLRAIAQTTLAAPMLIQRRRRFYSELATSPRLMWQEALDMT